MAPPHPSPSARQPALDALRGLAMLWMTAFHCCFDLQHFGWLQANFYEDRFWTWQRSAIVSLFLLCAGAGQALAARQGQPWRAFARRWGQIALCALAVSLGSWWMFPHSYIHFGILHGMALMLLLARGLHHAPARWLLALAVLALALPRLALLAHAQGPALEFLNARAFNWLGLISRKPVTEDYAPLFPWLGVMLLGLLGGRWLAQQRSAGLARWGLWIEAGGSGRALAWLGRHSLSYYMLHQPVLLGLLGLLALAVR